MKATRPNITDIDLQATRRRFQLAREQGAADGSAARCLELRSFHERSWPPKPGRSNS
jgi:hypothetical protein